MKHSNFKTNVHNLVLAAMFLALALVLPFLTGQIPQIGGMLLPMHLPVFLCGLICGWRYGAVVGFVAPLMRMALFGMPPLVAAVAMAFELAAYGGIAGFLYNRSRWQCVVALYRALLAAMVGGRIVWAAVRVVMTGVASVPFTWQIFLTEALVNAIPGIILQLVFIPVLMVLHVGEHLSRRHGPLPPGAGRYPGRRKLTDRRLLSQAEQAPGGPDTFRSAGGFHMPCRPPAHRSPPSWGAGSALPGMSGAAPGSFQHILPDALRPNRCG